MQKQIEVDILTKQSAIFQRQISCFKSYLNADNPKTITVSKWLKSSKYKDRVNQIRATKEKRKRDKLKATLPAIF